jgi:hypothetical protein
MKEAIECRTPGNAEIVWTAAGITLHGQRVGVLPHPPHTPDSISGVIRNTGHFVNEHYSYLSAV